MERVYNKTFRSGELRYNACVGENGIFDGKYFLGYDLSVKVLCKTLIKDTTEIDQLIFPLVFNARHAIELYLKDALYNIFKINESINFIKDIDIDVHKLQSTHNLDNLWQMFENNSIKLDRRMQDYIDYQKEYISDYFEIDLSGETFRYQYTKENATHLSKTPLINVIHFYERYIALSESMHKLIRFIDQVKYEYHIYPYTKTLSPNDFLVISKRLGDISTWKEDAFKEIKKAIKTEYSIGSNELCNAVNIIKETPEYSRFIGIENYFLHASKEKILIAIKILNESIDNYKEDFEKFKDFTIDELLCINVLISEYDIRTRLEYTNCFEIFKRDYSIDEAIDNLILRNQQVAIRRINENLKRFGISNL